jgi:Flp pilus assembly protein TadG
MRRNKSRRGSTMVEFALAGIPMIMILISTVDLSIGMWQYHTLASALQEGTRAVIPRGRGCTMNNNTCGMTVGTIAKGIASAALGISPAELNVTLTTASGQTQSCNPLNTCFSNSTAWPPSTNNDDLPGKAVTISGRLPFYLVLGMVVAGSHSVDFAPVTLSASSAQTIQF